MFRAISGRKQPRDRTLRCLNCFTRMDIPQRADRYTCAKCNTEYEIGWRSGQAKILGLVDYYKD